MPLSHKPIAAIQEADLQELIEARESESKTIDYKRSLPGTDRREYLYDVSSFANALGGHLIFGMIEKDGLPIELVGLSGINPDNEIRRIDEMARDGIRPSISGLQSITVPLMNGNTAIVVRIPKSWNPPHQVTYQKAFRFYGRDSNGKYQLDVDELRTVFTLSETITEKIQRFRIDRIARIAVDDMPTTLALGGRMVTHMLPLSAFSGLASVNLKSLDREYNLLGNIAGGIEHDRFNTDGFVVWSKFGYLQVYRSGCLEAIRVFSSQQLPSVDFESRLFNHIDNGKKLLQILSVECPVVILVSFVGIKGWRIAVSSAYRTSALDVFDRERCLSQKF